MSDDSDDDYVEFGTPLEPLDEDVCPRKKPLLIEEQVAKDKHGRRRFHGAFTGGFSAGFLNTVGSLEGFKPSSFKSSKSEKGTVVVQRPEDFMDDEDMGEFGIAPSVLRPKEDFQSIETYKRKYPGYLSGPELGTVLRSLLQPVRETVGIKLLRKMGWKPGQGVGPRVSKSEKNRVARMRKTAYGSSSKNLKSDGDDSETSDIDDEDLKNITFAPSDYPFQLVTPKENVFGLGYKGLEKRSILSAPQAKPENNSGDRRTITGQAFGVGALEEEDEDIYSKEDMSQYDFTLGDCSKEGASASDCVIGEDLYDRFDLSIKRKKVPEYKPPVLPADFKPVRKVTRFEEIVNPKKSTKLSTSPERQSTAEEMEAIQKEARKLTEDMGSDTPAIFKPFVTNPNKQERYEKFLDLLALGKPGELHKFQPITMTDWEKERELVEFQQAAKLFRPLSGSIEDRFTPASQAEDVHDPLAPVESFSTATYDEIQAASVNMYGDLTRTVEDWKPCSLLCKRFNVREPFDVPVKKETQMKGSIFDDLEECLQEANTYEEVRTVRRRETASTSRQETITREQEASTSRQETSTRGQETSTLNQESKATTSKPPETDITEKDKESENSELKNNLYENKVDLFNAIFRDTDSEEEEEEEVVEASVPVQITAQYFQPRKPLGEYDKELGMEYEDDIVNEKRNTSPARGIFENLDYDLLKPKKPTTEMLPQHDDAIPGPSNYDPYKDKGKKSKSPSPTHSYTELQYGPKLPDKFPERKFHYFPPSTFARPSTSQDNSYWVERSPPGSPRYQRKHKKNKKHKKRSK